MFLESSRQGISTPPDTECGCGPWVPGNPSSGWVHVWLFSVGVQRAVSPCNSYACKVHNRWAGSVVQESACPESGDISGAQGDWSATSEQIGASCTVCRSSQNILTIYVVCVCVGVSQLRGRCCRCWQGYTYLPFLGARGEHAHWKTGEEILRAEYTGDGAQVESIPCHSSTFSAQRIPYVHKRPNTM